ncbi:MAG TPA: helix-turn-helix transcriptional regulator [Verrucomicrobiae bacterium]|nr:helix-turn-helix transcriptional regulator [Verrucomicrobiae bacterium]
MKQRNFIGRLVSKLRNQQRLTQDDLAVELQFRGWHDATRDTVAKIEGGSLRIDLIQICYLAAALEVQPIQFLSKIDWSKQIEDPLCFENQQPVESYGNRK